MRGEESRISGRRFLVQTVDALYIRVLDTDESLCEDSCDAYNHNDESCPYLSTDYNCTFYESGTFVIHKLKKLKKRRE